LAEEKIVSAREIKPSYEKRREENEEKVAKSLSVILERKKNAKRRKRKLTSRKYQLK